MMTSRLSLRPFSPGDLLALIDGAAQCEQRMGVRLSEGLREFFVSGEVSAAWLERLRAGGTADPWVHGFALVEREQGIAIGTAGFKGPPDEGGVVEIAYGIVPSYEGRGYATEAAAGLVDFAFADARVNLVRAHTLPTANASTRVLGKNGFTHVGEIVDPEDGPVWRWERKRSSLAST
jgi:ribosomal-protein-alanine N-acetyltransferase